MLLIDRIAYENRLLTVSPGLKTCLYVLLLAACFLSGPWQQLGIIVVMAGLTMYVAKVHWRRYLKWLAIPLPFLVLSFVTIVLTVASKKDGLLLAIPFFGNFLGISSASMELGVELFFRSFSCLACTYFYALTVPFQQILSVMKRCHLPLVFIEITMLMYRFIFIFLDEVSVIRKSQEMRFGYHGLKNSYQSLGLLLKLIFAQTFERFQAMNVSLEMKFFTGDFPL